MKETVIDLFKSIEKGDTLEIYAEHVPEQDLARLEELFAAALTELGITDKGLTSVIRELLNNGETCYDILNIFNELYNVNTYTYNGSECFEMSDYSAYSFGKEFFKEISSSLMKYNADKIVVDSETILENIGRVFLLYGKKATIEEMAHILIYELSDIIMYSEI